jgi:NAD(P)-dependent dehydrogenase (short-subunit alcohol dehydrogenase family)
MPHSQKVILVTGSTDGIGMQTALELLQLGARVLVHGRNPARTQEAAERLARKSGNPLAEGVVADLSSMEGARALVAAVKARTDVLHVLINNAGVYMKEKALSPDGLEMSFAVNHVGHFVLTHGLMPLLLKGAPSRVVNVSSVAHNRGRVDFGNLRAEKRFDDYEAYAQSKLCNVLFAAEFARRVDASRVCSYALHPGVINTKLLKEGFGNVGTSNLAEGSATSVWLATSPQVAGISGRYYSDVHEAQPSALGREADLAAELWEETEKLTGISGAWA